MISNYDSKGLPLDAVYLDIPYQDNEEDFKVNKTKFPNLQ